MYKPVPPRVDFPALEHEILRFWEEHRTFDKLRERNVGGPRFSFIDGPITANNPMGVHHAWGRTYKDIYQRFYAMKGYEQRYQNGFDCQGLWVEVEVEKALELNSKRQIEEYGLDRFADACRERVLTYARVITDQSIRLGQWMDWDNSYFTMTDNNIEHIWHFLKRCHEKGWLYRDWRTMPWCARCGTSLSQHELIGTDSYRDMVHPSVFVKMPIEGRPSEYFLVWTTTPWTLPANVALAVHPDLEYAKVSLEGETYYLSAKTVPVVLRGRGQEVQTLRGSDLLEWRYRTPFADLAAQEGIVHRVVPWNDVGEDEGTGIVHIAPGCGVEDFGLGKEQRLAVVVPIDDNGIFLPGFGPLAGKSVHSVNDEVIQLLGERGMLHRVEQIEHRYPTCWRCGQPIVFRAATEWFISAQEIRPRMLEAARTVEWTPPSALKRMEDWLHNMQDWCISRRRYWGLPLPFYDCPVCKSLTVVGSVDELRQLSVSGMDEVRELHRPWIDAVRIRCPGCGREVERIAEVGDCWLDAGIVPFSTLGPGALKDPETWQKWYPAHWVSEMREQIRLWFYSMLFMSVTLEDRAPYQRVLTYEKLMDEKGQPMHKSLGNAIWFDEAADKMGADVMRWLYAGQNLQTNLLFGYGPAEEVRRRLLTLWNVYSYYVTHAETEGFVPSASLAEVQLSRMDRWVLSRLQSLLSLADDRLRAYDVGALVSATDRFVDDLSTWYLRRSRRRFSRSASPEDRRAAFATLYECLLTLARTVAPVMPFLAEELYQNLVRSWDRDAPESIHLTPYPEADLTRVDPELEAEMALAQDIVRLGRSARTEAGIRVRQPLAAITVCRGETGIELSTELCEEIADELNVKEVQFAAEVEAFARRVVRPNPKLLGPRLGRELPEVSRALQAREYTIDQDGSVRVGPHVLTGDEVSITLEPAADQAIAQDLQVQGGLAVALDRALTSELLAEGRVRELIRRVQTMRQEAGLSIEDRINLAFDGSPSWKEIITVNAEQIRGAVGAVQLNGDIAAATARELRWSGKLDDEEVSLTLSRVT